MQRQSNNDNTDKYILQSVDNALSILDILCEHETLSAQEISVLTGLGKSSSFRLLTTLCNRAYVQKDSNARYSLGLQFYKIQLLLNARGGLASQLRSFLVEIGNSVEDTCHLSVLHNNSQVLFLDSIQGKAQVRVESSVGMTKPLYVTSAGKVLLAYQPRPFVRGYAKSVVFEPYTPNSIRSVSALYSCLEEIRKDGYACDNEEFEIGLTCYAVPILNARSEAIAAFCISGPTTRMIQQKEKYITVLKQAANHAAEALKSPIIGE